MALNIERFKNNFGSPARPTLFQVQINFPTGNTEKDTFMCKGAQVPTRTVGLIEIPYMGRRIKYAGDSTFEAWTVTVLNDNDFTIRKKLEQWAEIINGARDNISAVDPRDYKRDLKVSHLDGAGNVVKEYVFIGAYPSNVGDEIDLSWENNDQPEEYGVMFEYDYWESETTRGGLNSG